MSEWTILHTEVWTDPPFVELTPEGKLLFLWSWTNPEAAICGLYTVSPKRMRQAMGERPGDKRGVWQVKVDAALRELASKPLVLYDDANEVLWVPARAARANRSAKAAAIMVKEFQRCPASLLRDAFADRYPALTRGA